MIAAVIAVILILIICGVLYFVFNLAFIRQNITGLDDLDSPTNKFLQDYRTQVEEGMNFIDNQPYELINTKSFDGLKLFGRYYKNGDSDRTILLFHGYRSAAKRDFACAVELYYKLGLNILLVDQRCHGLSEGKIITFGVKESRDVLSWIDFILDKYGDKTLYLDGISMGATTVLLSTRFELKNVKGIIADCGFTSPADIIGVVAKNKFKVSEKLAVPVMNFLCRIFAGFDLKEFSTAKVLKNNKIPLLFVHGKNDRLVPCCMTEEAYNSATGQKIMYLVDGADHGMSFLTDNKGVVDQLNSFLEFNR